VKNPLQPLVTLDLCFYLGDDVKNSHVPYFPWFKGDEESYKKYINKLTLATRKILSEFQIRSK